MRDGVHLSVDIYVPKSSEKLSGILTLVPYDNNMVRAGGALDTRLSAIGDEVLVCQTPPLESPVEVTLNRGYAVREGRFNSAQLSTIEPGRVYQYTVRFWRGTGNLLQRDTGFGPRPHPAGFLLSAEPEFRGG